MASMLLLAAYQSGLDVDFTSGLIPSLYKLLVLLKFTILKITLCREEEILTIIATWTPEPRCLHSPGLNKHSAL